MYTNTSAQIIFSASGEKLHLPKWMRCGVGAITIVEVPDGCVEEQCGWEGTAATCVGKDCLEWSGDCSDSYKGGLRPSSAPNE